VARVTAAEIRERDGFRCCRCGEGGTLHVHHRIRRSQGGEDTASNQVTLCAKCHQYVHANPYGARREGLLLQRDRDPARIPVDHALFPAGPVLLGPDLEFIPWQTGPRQS